MFADPQAFGEWAPDYADIAGNILKTARNVFPSPSGYRPVLGLLAQSTTALPLICRGLWFVQRTDGGYDTYAATSAKLYKYNADTLAFDDISGAATFNLPADDFWSAVQFGNRLIFCQLGNFPLYIDIDIGTVVATLPNAPIARFVTVAEDRVVFSSLSSNPREIQWSAINDSEDYTSGTAGNQEFVDHGAVMGFFPHARIVLLERGMRGIVPTGDIIAFQFPELTNEKGTTSPWSCIELGQRLYYLSVDGYYVVGGNFPEPVNISENRVSKYFFESLNQDRRSQVYGTFDPFSTRLHWTYPTSDTEYNDRIMNLDYSLPSDIGAFGRWSETILSTYVMARLATAATSLEGGSDSLDMDELGLPSLDSAIYRAGAPILVGIGTDLKLSTLAGDTLEATLGTGTYNFTTGRRTKVLAVLPVIFGEEADRITINISKKKRSNDTWSATGAIGQQASGWHRFNADGMFHKAEFVIPAAATWTHAESWMPDLVPTSGR